MAAHRMLRENERQQRLAQKRREADHRMHSRYLDMCHSRAEFKSYARGIEALTDIGRRFGGHIDWNVRLSAEPPPPPPRSNANEVHARQTLQAYEPGFFARISGKSSKILQTLQGNVRLGQDLDEREHLNSLEEHRLACEATEQQRLWAAGILEGNLEVFKQVADSLTPSNEFWDVGAYFGIKFTSNRVCTVSIGVADLSVVPTESKSLTSTGKISVRSMASSRRMEIYQGYVCGSLFRMAREISALLPVEFVICSAFGNLLDSSTGLREEHCICSAGFPVRQFSHLNFEQVDFFDALRQFRHKIKFTKRSGFGAVTALDIEDFDLSWIGSLEPLRRRSIEPFDPTRSYGG